jgi:glutathione synthase
MDFAFILDPLPELKAYKDSSVAMMRELARRGHRLFAFEQREMFWDVGVTRARARPLELFDDDHAWYREGAADVMRLTDFGAVIMRKDPPFDMEYIYSTYLLECAEQEARASSTVRARSAITTRRWRSRNSRSSSRRRW